MSKKLSGFLDHLISIGDRKFSLLLREYWQFQVSMLSRSPKISYLIENNVSQLNRAQNEEKVPQKHFFADFRSFWS